MNSLFACLLSFLVACLGICSFLCAEDKPPQTLVITGSETLGEDLFSQWAFQYKSDVDQEVNFLIVPESPELAFRRLIEGTSDLVMTPRISKLSEDRLAWDQEFFLVATPIVLDSIAVIVHPENPIKDLSIEQLAKIYSGEIRNWKLLGGLDQEISPLKGEDATGLEQTFLKLVLDKQGFVETVQSRESAAEVFTTIATNPAAIAFVSKRFLAPESKVLLIEGLSLEKIQYPLVQSYFVYTRNQAQGLVKDFINFCLSDEGDFIARELNFTPYTDLESRKLDQVQGDIEESFF